jgi:enoyl-CoA hydratase
MMRTEEQDSSAPVKMELDEGVAVLTLINPPLNVLSRELYRELEARLDAISQDEGVRVVVLTAAGTRAFSAGANIKEFASYTTAEEARAFGDMIHRTCSKLSALRQPTIVAIERIALGGGCELILYCDLRIASREARFGFPEVTVGQFPGTGGTEWLPRLIGEAPAKALMFTGDIVDAVEAHRLGLVNRLVEPGQADTAARDLARTIANRPAVAVQAIKESINRGRGIPADAHRLVQIELMQRVFQSEDAVEGYTAFMEKRQPRFKHR